MLFEIGSINLSMFYKTTKSDIYFVGINHANVYCQLHLTVSLEIKLHHQKGEIP